MKKIFPEDQAILSVHIYISSKISSSLLSSKKHSYITYFTCEWAIQASGLRCFYRKTEKLKKVNTLIIVNKKIGY